MDKIFSGITIKQINFNNDHYNFESINFDDINSDNITFLLDVKLNACRFSRLIIDSINVKKSLKVFESEIINSTFSSIVCSKVTFSNCSSILGSSFEELRADSISIENCNINDVKYYFDCSKIKFLSSTLSNKCILNLKKSFDNFSIINSKLTDIEVMFNEIEQSSEVIIDNNSLTGIKFADSGSNIINFEFSGNKNAIKVDFIDFKLGLADLKSKQNILFKDNEITNFSFTLCELFNSKFHDNTFKETVLKDSAFNNAVIKNTTFINANFDSCQFNSCNKFILTGSTKIHNCSFFNSELIAGNALVSDFLILTDTKFNECCFESFVFHLTAADYYKNFNRCLYKNILFNCSERLSINFDDSNLSNVNFTQLAAIFNSSFVNSTITGGFSFEKPLEFIDSTFKNTTIENVIFLHEITFKNCNFNEVKFIKCKFNAKVNFIDCIFDLCAFESSAINESIIFNHCQCSNINFIKSTSSADISFINGLIKDHDDYSLKGLRFFDSSIMHLSIRDCRPPAISLVKFVNVSINGTVDLSGLVIAESSFENIKFTNGNSKLSFEGSEFVCVNIGRFDFENIDFKNNINVRGLKKWQEIIGIQSLSQEKNFFKDTLYIQNHSDEKFINDVHNFLVSNNQLFFCYCHKIYLSDFIGFNDFSSMIFADVVFKDKIFFKCSFNNSGFNKENFINCNFINCYFDECEKCKYKLKCYLDKCLNFS